MKSIQLETLRTEILGINEKFLTPYGERIMTYADYTASGKPLKFIEEYLLEIQKFYANSHTEDDITGKTMTRLIHKAEQIIKNEVNGTKENSVIAAGSGSTGAMETLAKILGIYIPPATRKTFQEMSEFSDYPQDIQSFLDPGNKTGAPVVFIGPFEHHSNILLWRESVAEVVNIGLDQDGYLDLEELKRKVSDPKYKKRRKIGSFSAGSNITGVKTPVYEVAGILHDNDAIACFDFAASGPYVEINMNRDGKAYFDAVSISPHKFIGGPGSSGILVINNRIYDTELPPTVMGGGTVDYVSDFGQDYIHDIEEREKAGTPGIIQIMKAALAIELKGQVGVEQIDRIEEDYTEQFIRRFKDNKNIEILGPMEPEKRISIISFVIKHNEAYLHPRYATMLLNDLFGVQSRAGCSCAGPYGHKLLGIDDGLSERFRSAIQNGYSSIKPGWVRVNLHYTMTQDTVDFILDTIEFVVNYGYLFLNEYQVCLKSGSWSHMSPPKEVDLLNNFGVMNALSRTNRPLKKHQEINLAKERSAYLSYAMAKADGLKKTHKEEYSNYDNPEMKALKWFHFIHKA